MHSAKDLEKFIGQLNGLYGDNVFEVSVTETYLVLKCCICNKFEIWYKEKTTEIPQQSVINSGIITSTIPATDQTTLYLTNKINLQHDMKSHKVKGLLPQVAYQEVTK